MGEGGGGGGGGGTQIMPQATPPVGSCEVSPEGGLSPSEDG